MNWDKLSERSKAYVERYIRGSTKTKEEALQEKIVQEVIKEYEQGTKERLVFV